MPAGRTGETTTITRRQTTGRVTVEVSIQPAPAPEAAVASAPPRAARVVVVGAGLAGLVAALDLQEAGFTTTLVEKRPFPGGKAYSFADPGSGHTLDNGQHVFLRCCSAYRALLQRLDLGAATRLQDHLRVPVLDPDTGVVSSIEAGPAGVAAPWHLTKALARFAHLSWGEKARLGRAVLPMRRMGEAGRRRLGAVSFGDWLRDHGQTDRVIERFWDLIVLPTCNDRSDAVSAQQAIMVFQVGLLNDAHGADMGMVVGGLSRVADAALLRFTEAGGTALLRRRALTVLHDGVRAAGVAMAGGDRITADAVVLALPPAQALALLPEAWRRRDEFAALDGFETAPIVNVHLHFDRRVLDEAFIAVLDPWVQYVFAHEPPVRPDAPTAPPADQWVTVSLSGAFDAATLPQAEVAQRVLEGLRRAFPEARGAQVRQRRVVKEIEATFRPRPGIEAKRPGPRTSVPNLVLAGAWTATEWPATMESAVRSGHAAAALVPQILGRADSHA